MCFDGCGYERQQLIVTPAIAQPVHHMLLVLSPGLLNARTSTFIRFLVRNMVLSSFLLASLHEVAFKSDFFFVTTTLIATGATRATFAMTITVTCSGQSEE